MVFDLPSFAEWLIVLLLGLIVFGAATLPRVAQRLERVLSDNEQAYDWHRRQVQAEYDREESNEWFYRATKQLIAVIGIMVALILGLKLTSDMI